MATASLTGIQPALAQQPCGSATYPFPYTDVGSVTDPFCPGIMEAYVTGISKGTTPTTFSPNDDVIRLQMTTFLQRTVDQVLTRESRRAALDLNGTPQNTNAMQSITLGGLSEYCAADGQSIWTTDIISNRVDQTQASTGISLGHWTSASNPQGVLAAMGKIFVAGDSPSSLYLIDPTQPPGTVILAASGLGASPMGIAFDGNKLWTANHGGSVSIITPQATTPYGAVTTVSTGFTGPTGILYDGAHIWVTDQTAGTLLKLDPTGAILQTVTVGNSPKFPVFDGSNIWVPNAGSNSITVVQASTGNVVATISADATNMLSGPLGTSFDGERVLVINGGTVKSVTVFKAADLSFIANVSTGILQPIGACSDGVNFWITGSDLLRF